MYTIPEIRAPLWSQQEDAQRWLTTSQMGWSLTRERNEITSEKDERVGKPVARQLAPMTSTFIRAQWESHELECIDGERRQILEEAAELDHIRGAWEAEAELTNDPKAASLIERDPEVIPDVDIAAKVGKDLFLDEKIPRHGSGQGYVRVVEHSVMWKEKEASNAFTYQGLTTCTEVDRSWTIMSSAGIQPRTKQERGGPA